MSAAATVFIATEANDIHADAVIRRLHELDTKVFRFHPEDVPTRCSITVSPATSGIDFIIRNAYHEVDSRDVVAAWYRRPKPVQPAAHSPDVDEYVRLQANAAVRAVYRALEGRWLAAPDALRVAEDKMLQLRRAAEQGLRVPYTRLSNDPDKVRKFHDRAAGSIVVKPSAVHGAFWDSGFRFPLATRWDGSASDESIAAAPTIFQEEIEKVIEVRAVVIGDQVFAAEIPATEDIDVRAHCLDKTYSRHELPPEIATKLQRLTHGLGVSFASADLVVTPSGEYVFLDLNPNGQWLWLEFDAGLPLTDAIVDYFLQSAPSTSSAT